MAGHRIGGGAGGGDDDANEQHQPLMGPSSPPPRSSSRSAMMSSDVEMANGRRRPLKATEKMWVVATVSLISFLSFSSQFCVLIPYWLSTPSVTWSQMLLYLVPFNCGVAGIFYNYYCVVYTSPGDVPPGWEPDWDALGGVEVKASTGSPRYCKVCRSYKPPRAHHCRVCKRCVLRMDHHCPWVANCVGHGNYGHFLRFLWTVDVTMAMHVALLSLRVADWWNPNMFWREPTTAAMVLMVLNFAQGVPVFIMVGAFSIYHTYALCTNTTTIEGWEKDKVAMLVRRGKIEEVKYPYDLGMKRNIQSILGKRALFWCMPGQGPLGNGLDYNLAEGHAHVEQFFWPPRDPSRPQQKSRRRRNVLEGSAFTFGEGNFNPALRPTNSRLSQDHNQRAQQPTLRRRGSQPGGQAAVEGNARGTRAGGTGWSQVPPYHPDYHVSADSKRRRPRRTRATSGESTASESSASSAEEAGVVDAGCIPPGAIPGMSTAGVDRSTRHRHARGQGSSSGRDSHKYADGAASDPEEHELMDAAERRRWGAHSGEVFPRLFAEEEDTLEDDRGGYEDDEMGSEGYGSSEAEDDGEVDGDGLARPQLHSRVRRGSEGYEVRPMMFDEAYAADMRDEEERLRRYLMQERERLGEVWDPDVHGHPSGYGYNGWNDGVQAQYAGPFYDGQAAAEGAEGMESDTEDDTLGDVNRA